jgi:hypothetical protein
MVSTMSLMGFPGSGKALRVESLLSASGDGVLTSAILVRGHDNLKTYIARLELRDSVGVAQVMHRSGE